MRPLTSIQQRLVDAIVAFKADRGFAPSVRELGEAVGLAISTVHHHIDTLERAGVVTREANLPRTLVVVDQPEEHDAHPVEDPSPPDPGVAPASG